MNYPAEVGAASLQNLELVRGTRPLYRRMCSQASTILFDRRYGVRTEEEVELDTLGVAAPGRNGYMPYSHRLLRRVLSQQEVTDREVFLDVGSGMGRVVLQAAMHYPFRRVIGVEVSRQLNDVAVANVCRLGGRLRCRSVVLVHADILDFDIPADASVVFVFNPFSGVVFRRFVERLLESIDRYPRKVRIIYADPKEEATLLATGRVTQVRTRRGWGPSALWSQSNVTRTYRVLPAGRAEASVRNATDRSVVAMQRQASATQDNAAR
jgi:SAM-dependent methyltransferase